MIHVCSLARLHSTVKDTGARHVVSLIMNAPLTRPDSILVDDHLILKMDDIIDPSDTHTIPCEDHVERLISFVTRWKRESPMVVHCYAGISRSTAAAFTAACALNPKRDELQIAWALRQASRTAQPNKRIIAIADQMLGRQGRMIHAVETIGPGTSGAIEGIPFRLDLD